METRLINDLAAVPVERVSAVFVIAFDGQRVLAIENERGWDIPGGYVEPGEAPDDALTRELIEEAGATVDRRIPVATLANSGAETLMLVYAGSGITLGEFVPKPDALGRELMDTKELLGRYRGDRKLLSTLIEAARGRVATAAS